MAPRTGSDSARFERIRLLGRGHEGTFWLLHFLAYRAQQYDLETGELLQEIDREPSWMAKSSSSGSADWRYASLLAAFQPARDRLWILGRSNEPEYSPGALSDPTAPLAGRESVWDLQLELLSLPEGELLASITLPHWIGGFTTDGMLFFFDELESDWGQIVVVRLSFGEDQPRAK